MIDQEGINSLNIGAEPITYQGTEGPKSPEQDQAMAMGIPEGLTVDEAIETFKASEGRDPNNIEEVIEFFQNRTLSGGQPLPEDPTKPINPFGPKPIGPPLPDRQMAAFGGIMGLDNRKQYGIGSKFKRILNKVTKPFTKIARKLVPKELAGPLRTVAPFLPPGFREAAYLAGTAKQKGKFNIGDLAFVGAPYARFTQAGVAPGEGTFGTDTKFSFGKGTADNYGIRDLLTGGETGGAYETQTGGKGLLGQIKLGQSDLGQYTDEFIFGAPKKPDTGTIDPFATAESGTNVMVGGSDARPGILGMGGEMSVLGGAGGAPGITESILGDKAFLGADGKPSMLKLGSWAVGIVSGIQAAKYKDEQEAAEAAEAALLAENEAASQAQIQAARDWAIETFGSMSVYAEGGRIGYGLGNLVKGKVSASMSAGDAPSSGRASGMGGMIAKFIGKNPQLFKKNISSNNQGQGLNLMASNLIEENQEIFNNFIDENENGIDDRREVATGGRINKNMGGEFNMPPAGLSSLQTQQSDVTPQGMELDLRGGGFIPIGKAEKADDVPARVSKNEFVFTADAVKAAGGGSVNEGAKRMYDTMKRLESQVV